MDIQTTRFGQITIEESEVIHMPKGILGFDELKHYVIIPHTPASPYYCWYQSTEKEEIAFVLCSPNAFISDYKPELNAFTKQELHIDGDDQVAIFNIATFRDNGKQIFLNLCAPIVINVNKKLSLQVILDEKKFPLRYELPQFVPVQNQKPISNPIVESV